MSIIKPLIVNKLKNAVLFMSDFSSNKFRRVQDRCKACLELLGRYPDSDVPEKFEMISDLYSYLGNATMQLGNLDLALEYHQMDLTIGDQLLVSFIQLHISWILYHACIFNYVFTLAKAFFVFLRDKRNIRYRALGNTGRVLMMKGKYNRALDM